MKPNGGPAFPEFEHFYEDGNITTIKSRTGMTLRDYFAAAALQGILASNYDPYGGEQSAASDDSACALHAYNIADAMILERVK